MADKTVPLRFKQGADTITVGDPGAVRKAQLDDETAALVTGQGTATGAALSTTYATQAQLSEVEVTDEAIAGPLSDPESASRAFIVGKPTADEATIFVTPRGSDANDGRTLMTAKATISGALAALAGAPGLIQLGARTIIEPAPCAIPSGTEIVGMGRGVTTVEYTGVAGSLFSSATPGVRSYNPRISNMFLKGPGKATDTIAINGTDVSNAVISDVAINGFGTGYLNASTSSGWAVYNDFTNVVFQNCTKGVDHQALGSNGLRYRGCKFGGNGIAANIIDSNQNSFLQCQFEVNDVGVFIDATLAGRSDYNSFIACRFETNSKAWVVNSNLVRATEFISPAAFGTYTFEDRGQRTVHLSGNAGWTLESVIAKPDGTWRFRRAGNGGAETPALLVQDTITTSGLPVTIQAETEQVNGFFFRGKRGGVTYFDVTARGVVQGSATTTALRPPTTNLRPGATSFDTTLGRPIWWNGSTWVDATGAPV